MDPSHHDRIIDQFSRQALPFSLLPAHSDAQALNLLASRCGFDGEQRLLDVACGPGLVALGLAGRCREVVGLDLTPAMLDRAETLRQERGIKNATWVLGDGGRLPWPDAAFDAVVTRFSVHHLQDPRATIDEMIRVCRPNGVVGIIDVATSKRANAAYNRMERFRDPSHTRALTVEELWQLGENSGLLDLRLDQYGLNVELEDQLRRSFPEPGGADQVRAFIHQDLADGILELKSRKQGGGIWFTYPVAQITGRKSVTGANRIQPSAFS